jgi:hypothetical protein
MGKQPRKSTRIILLIALLACASVARAFSFCFTPEKGTRSGPEYYSYRALSDGSWPRGFVDYPYNPVLQDDSWHQPYYPPPAANIGRTRGIPVNPWEVPQQPDSEQR